MYRGLLGLLGHGELVVLVTALHFTSLMVLKVTSPLFYAAHCDKLLFKVLYRDTCFICKIQFYIGHIA